MMRSGFLLLPLSVWLASCATQRRVSHALPVPNPPSYAVTRNIERQIKNARDAGEGDYLARELREKLVAEPNNVQVRLDLAAHLKRTGQPDLALEYLRVAAEKFPDNGAVALQLAKSLRDLGQADAALQTAVNFCNKHQPAPPGLISFMGVMLDDAGRLAEAEKVYRDGLRASPDSAFLHNNLGYNLLQQKRPADAVPEFQRALDLEPRSEVATNNLALALLAGWKTDAEPREALRRWQAIGDAATAHNNLASYLIEQRRYKDARKELAVALNSPGDHTPALRNLQLLADLEAGASAPPAALDGSANTAAGDDDLVTLWKRFTVNLQKVFSASKDQPKAAQTATK